MKQVRIHKVARGGTRRETHRIGVTAKERFIKHRREWKESLTVDYLQAITPKETQLIREDWIKSGRSLKEFSRVGTFKAREILYRT